MFGLLIQFFLRRNCARWVLVEGRSFDCNGYFLKDFSKRENLEICFKLVFFSQWNHNQDLYFQNSSKNERGKEEFVDLWFTSRKTILFYFPNRKGWIVISRLFYGLTFGIIKQTKLSTVWDFNFFFLCNYDRTSFVHFKNNFWKGIAQSLNRKNLFLQV